MEIMERRCRHCKIIYKPEKFSSYILFCSRCKREVFFNSNFDGETPCIIYLGDESIGEIMHISDDNYRISIDGFGIDEVVNNSKRPFIEIENYLNQAIGFLHGSMDVHEGVLLLHNEKLQKFYSFKDFKNTDMFCGQNGEMPFTLKDTYNIDNHNYYVSLLFKQGFLYEISLVCNDIEKDSYSMEKEKALHDSILKEYGLRNDEDLEWGNVASLYNPEANTSNIIIRFNYDEDELPMFYNSAINTDTSLGVPNDGSTEIVYQVDTNDNIVSDPKEEPIGYYLKRILNATDKSVISSNPDTLRTHIKEFKRFCKLLNCKDDRNKEVERLFLFLHNNGWTITKLVAVQRKQAPLFSQLKYTLELEDTFFNRYLYPPFQAHVQENVKYDEKEIRLMDFKRINSLSGYLADLNTFMSYFQKQWNHFIENLYVTIGSVCSNMNLSVVFWDAVTQEKECLKKFREEFYNVQNPDSYYDGTNDNIYKNLYLFCLISYLDDFYLSKFPDIRVRTFLEEYYLAGDSDINEGLDLRGYEPSIIPVFSDNNTPDFTYLKYVIPKKKYSLNDVAEAYAKSLKEDSNKVYKRLEKYFSDTGIFTPSKESGEYEFDDVILPIAAHLYYRQKNRKYDPDNTDLLSDNRIFNSIYYPLFKAKVYGREDIIYAYEEYRTIVIDEFERALNIVNDDYLIEAINHIIGKSSMRMSMRILGEDKNLINSI